MVKEDPKFSEIDVAEGWLFSKRKHHFPIDKPTLKKRAEMALKRQHDCPTLSFQEIMRIVLSDIDFSERRAYASGIGKMFSIRNHQHVPA
ncbi:MAG: hypothetical protein Q7J45_01095 [bacterium]|nr:hypothetical protein [bacterium]